MKNLKILSVIGLILIILALGSTDNPKQYMLETIGMLSVMAYAWNYIKDRIIMLWVAGFFVVVYTFLNYSLMDLIFWLAAFAFIYKKEVIEEKV